MSTPILNPPQSGILGMHAIKNRPMEYPVASGQIAIRPMMYLAHSYDHRIIDGAEAVQFLVKVKQCIEDPQRDGAQENHWMGMESTRGGGGHQNRYNWVFVTTGIFSVLGGFNSNGKP
jgi:hypothetical protein